MLCGASLSLTPAWSQGEVRRVPEKLALFLIHLPSWCKHFGGAHHSPSGPPAVSARGGGWRRPMALSLRVVVGYMTPFEKDESAGWKGLRQFSPRKDWWIYCSHREEQLPKYRSLLISEVKEVPKEPWKQNCLCLLRCCSETRRSALCSGTQPGGVQKMCPESQSGTWSHRKLYSEMSTSCSQNSRGCYRDSFGVCSSSLGSGHVWLGSPHEWPFQV